MNSTEKKTKINSFMRKKEESTFRLNAHSLRSSFMTEKQLNTIINN
jgi:hypothetical protein